MIKINVKPLVQETSNDCSITCMRMILNYYNISVSQKQIYSFIVKATKDGGSFSSEMARFAKSKKINVDLCAYNIYLTDPSDKNLSKKKLLAKLENQLKNSTRDKYYDLMLISTIKAIKKKVNYIIKKPSIQDIKNYITSGIPVSVRINYATLVNKQGDPFDSHDVVVAGINNDKVYIIDPADGSCKWFKNDDLMFAINQSKVISASAYLVAVKKYD